jgi:hypothetical protein
MEEKNNSNKITAILLAIIICVSIFAIIYVNLPQTTEYNNKETNNNEEKKEEEVLLTITYYDQELTYTLKQLEALTSYDGLGGKINKKSTITGPYNYTGVEISTFLNELDNPPDRYYITTTSSDFYRQEFTYEQISGNVTLYNETRYETGQGNLKMIISYKQEGEYLTDPEGGPLMVAFIEDYYTDSNLWTRMLVSLEITDI